MNNDMNNDILLLVPETNHVITANNFMPTLGVCYISSYLKLKGIKVKTIDNYLEQISHDKLLEKVNKIDFKILAVYIPSREMLYSFLSFIYKNIDKLTNNKNFKIVLGGIFASIAHEQILMKFKVIDFIILGFGEETLFNLYTCLDYDKALKSISNLAFYDKCTSKVVSNKTKEILNNNIPIPDIEYYFDTFGNKLTYTISCSRGCVGQCSFCIINKFYKYSHGKINLKHILNSISCLHEKEIKNFTFIDDNIFNSVIFENENFHEFYNFMKDKNLKFSFSARIIDILKYKNEIKLLKNIGLNKIFVGIESFYNDTLNLFNKNINREQIFDMLDFTYNSGLKISFGFIFFHPWTTIKEIIVNIEYLEVIYNRYKNISGSAPIQDLDILYKTDLYYKAKEEGLLKGNVFTDFGYNFEDVIVEKIYDKWKSENCKLLKRYINNSNYKGKLIFEQIEVLKSILKEVS